ncbi:hypothetical protein F5146DRAFT_1192257 [Armillaria mellea]|nr:hypothetical protein F5146DRAFT_1192257 [Armillaria mellea]
MASLSHQVSFDSTLGAILVGFAVSCVAFGAILVQTFHYFTRFPSDRLAYKIIVIVLLTLELLDQIFIGHTVYFYTIVNFANVLVVLRASMTWCVVLQVLSVTAKVIFKGLSLSVRSVALQSECALPYVSGDLANTTGSSRHSWSVYLWLTTYVEVYLSFQMLLNSGVLGTAIAFSIKSFGLPSVFAVAGLRVLGTVALGLGVVTDTVTAAALCYFLNKFRTGHARSDTLVNGLVIYAINTGAVTSLISATTLTLYNIMPDNLIFIAAYFLLSKLYAISFLATLNTRKVVRGRGTTDRNTSQSGGIAFQVTSRTHVSDPTSTDLQTNSHSAEFMKRCMNLNLKGDDSLGNGEAIPMHNIFHHREYDLPGMAV